MNADEANQALAAVATARRAVAEASAAPLWRHAAFGLVVALVVVSAASDAYRITAWIAAIAGVALLVAWDRRQTGMFVNGYRRGRTLPLTLALLVAITGLAFAAVRLSSHGEPMLALLMAPLAFAVALAASLAWERIFLREMGAAR